MNTPLSHLRMVAAIVVGVIATAALIAGIVAGWDATSITRVVAAACVSVLLLADVRGGPPAGGAAPVGPLVKATMAFFIAEGAADSLGGLF